jgi:hypothetical protein
LYAYFSHNLKRTKSLLAWIILWKHEVNEFWRTSKPIEFLCYS